MPLTSVREPASAVSPATKNSSAPSDVRVLVAKFQNGDTTAFEAIYLAYAPMITGFVHSRVDDEHLAEDLVSEVFARALAAVRDLQWRSDAEFSGWLVTIARNLIAGHFQRAETRRAFPSPRAGDGMVDDRNAEAAPEHTVVGHTHLVAVLRQLGPRQCEVVVHRVLFGRSVEETAELLGCNESVVKHALSKARRRLGALLLPQEVAVA